jgi:SAM-dependent methyltransferase
VSGFDYAPEGVELARAALSAGGVTGDIRLGDLFGEVGFDPHSFDVVWSAGFIEHFTHSADVVSRMARFAKPGGIVITEVPNMGGFIGKLHKWADVDLYSQHFVITPEKMDSAHTTSGLIAIKPAQYFGTLELGVVGYGRRLPARVLPWFNRAVGLAETIGMSPLWACRGSIESANLSPLVVGVYRNTVGP